MKEHRANKGKRERWGCVMWLVSDRPGRDGGRVRSDGEMNRRRREEEWRGNLGRRSAAALGGS